MVVELSLPRALRAAAAGHRAHPAVLDRATSAVQLEADGQYLPFLYRSVTFFRPVPPDAVSVARRIERSADAVTADIDVFDDRGRHVCAIEGFTMRRVDPATFVVPAPTPAAGTDADMITPEQGIGVLRAVLSGTPRPVTAVFPAGQPPTLSGYLSAARPGTPIHPAPTPVAVPPPAARTAAPMASSPAVERPRPAEASAASPGTSSEVRLMALWHEIVGDVGSDLDADLLEQGGTSLALVQLVTRIRDRFAIELGVGTVFELSTIRGLAAEISRLEAQ
jgi:acyl carrier protein